MKRIGVMADELGASQLSECLLESFNSICESDVDADTIVFYKKHPILRAVPLFSCMEQTEVWGYEGVVVATCLSSAETLLQITGPTKKFFYVWDLEWTRKAGQKYSKLKSVYDNPNIHLIARSEHHAKIIEACWKKPLAIIKDFDAQALLSLCGE